MASVFALFADADEAGRIARIVLEERLAACANIGPDVRSLYRWQGEIVDSREVAASFKTTAAQADHLIARIAELHSYDVPCIVSSPVDKLLAAYGDWVESEVRR